MSTVRLSLGKIGMGSVHTQKSMSANAWLRQRQRIELLYDGF